MVYKYRYGIGLAISALMIVIMLRLDFLPRKNEIKAMRLSMPQLMKTLEGEKKEASERKMLIHSVATRSVAMSQASHLETIFLLLHQEDLTLQHANMPSREAVILSLNGDFLAWQRFVDWLLFKYGFSVANFSFKQNNEGEGQIKMHLSLPIGSRGLSQAKRSVIDRSPMCNQNMHFRIPDKKNDLSSYPLSQIKIKGTIQDKKQARALVGLPNHRMFEVKPGDLIGEEAATLLEIKSNSIIVSVNGKRKSL